MSYWNALIESGSWVSSASSPPCGIEKGLWEKSIFFSSSFHSYIGKSTIQQNSNTSFFETPRSLPMRMRARAREPRRPGGLVAGEEHGVARDESFALAISACCASALRNLAIGPLPASAVAFALEDDVAEARGALARSPSR